MAAGTPVAARHAFALDPDTRQVAETQNTNVPACRFYRRMGCKLAAIDRFPYTNLPDEAQLIRIKEL